MAAGVAAARVVAGLAMSQWGLITTAQARAEGLTGQQLARLADTGALERVRHGVYRVAGSPPQVHEDLCAAWLALSPSETAHERLANEAVEVVSHRSAAMVHELGDLDADRLEFTTRNRKQARDPQVRLHRRVRGVGAWTRVDGLPVTTVLTTIGDLAATPLDGGHLAGVVRDAVTTHHVDAGDVSIVLGPYAHQYGAPFGRGDVLLDTLLDQAGVPAGMPPIDGQMLSEAMNTILRGVAEQVADSCAVQDAVRSALEGAGIQAAIEGALQRHAISQAVQGALNDSGLHEVARQVVDGTVHDSLEHVVNASKRSAQ